MPKTDKYLQKMRAVPTGESVWVAPKVEARKMKMEAAQIVMQALRGQWLSYSEEVDWAWQVAKADTGTKLDSRGLVAWAKDVGGF